MEVIQGDITDYSSVLEASRGAHVIVHVASLVDVWYKIPDSLIYSVNIKGEAPTGRVVIRDGEETPIGERLHPGNHKREEIASGLEDFQGLVSACDLIITRCACVTFKQMVRLWQRLFLERKRCFKCHC